MNGEVQQFATAPQAVGARKQKRYRDPDATMVGNNNMMHDKRVVRGNTYASVVEPSKQPDAAEVQRQRDAQRRRLMRANQTRQRPGTPEPVPGRKHMDIQTDSYLEELTERTVEFEAETQTDFLLDRPPSPLFMPAKIGVDIETQIEEGDLFDFDVECEPVLEVLVGKTLEQGMMEVLEEEELESLRRHQEDFEKRRNTELLEVQRMEAAEKRRADEMQRRIEQQALQRETDLRVMQKVVSRSIAAAHMSSLKDRALAHLLDAGVFVEPKQVGVDSLFMPDLLQKVVSKMERNTSNHLLVGDIMQRAMSQRVDTHQKKLDTERRRLAVIDEAEREARKEIKAERLRREAEQKRLEEEQATLIEWEATMPKAPDDKWAVLPADFATVIDDTEPDKGFFVRAWLLAEDGSIPGEEELKRFQVKEDEKEALQALLATDITTLPEGVRLLGKYFSSDEVQEGGLTAFKWASYSEDAAPPPDVGGGDAEPPADGATPPTPAPPRWTWVEPAATASA